MYVPYLNKQPEFRYERKFPVKRGLLSELAMNSVIKTSPAFFSEIYHKRQVNSVYLDTSSFDLYRENVVGQSRRFKFRIRWYGDNIDFASKPKLEVKVKYGLTGDKWVYSLPDFEVNKLNGSSILELAAETGVPELLVEQIHFLSPVLLNTYERRYYLSVDKKFRLTWDQGMTFFRYVPLQGRFLGTKDERTDYVIELKYKPEHDAEASRIATQFPFRVDKFSKYVTGCDLFYNIN